MQKVYVLDTSVLLHDEYSWTKFEDNVVYIPLTVIKELERIKEEKSERGRKSRHFARMVLSRLSTADLTNGIRLSINDQDGLLHIGNTLTGLGDEGILNICDEIVSREYNGLEVVLVTNDKYLEITSKVRGQKCEPYKNDRIKSEYRGVLEIDVRNEVIDRLYAKEHIDLEELGELGDVEQIENNIGMELRSDIDPKKTAIGVYKDRGDKGVIELLKKNEVRVSNVKAMNIEQRFAISLLTDPDVHLVTITGATGSGKTLLTLAAALQSLDDGMYGKLIITRAEVSVGNERGFLPGNDKEKAGPWLKGIKACVDEIMETANRCRNGYAYSNYEYFENQGVIQAETLAYVRGMTWRNSFVLIDEAQNLTLKEIKALITRAGNGPTATKVVLLGDTDQIDHPYLDSYSNGLSQVVDRFKGWKHYGHIRFTKTVRSLLANEAGIRL